MNSSPEHHVPLLSFTWNSTLAGPSERYKYYFNNILRFSISSKLCEKATLKCQVTNEKVRKVYLA